MGCLVGTIEIDTVDFLLTHLHKQFLVLSVSIDFLLLFLDSSHFTLEVSHNVVSFLLRLLINNMVSVLMCTQSVCVITRFLSFIFHSKVKILLVLVRFSSIPRTSVLPPLKIYLLLIDPSLLFSKKFRTKYRTKFTINMITCVYIFK